MHHIIQRGLIAGLACCAGIGIIQARKNVGLPQYPYQDQTLTIEERVNDLIGRMTLHEKIMQMQNRYAGSDVSKILGSEGIGTVHEMNLSAEDCRDRYLKLQSYARDSTRLGIPVLTCAEGIQGIIQNGCTLYPHALAQGATWNPELIKQMTYSAGNEAVAIGIHQILSPVLDLGRELRWGRVEETFGEDPYLVAEMATAFIEGYQEHPGITCTPKHFVAHGTPQGGLNCAEVKGGTHDLWSLYLYPFAKVIERTDPWSVMSCYSAYDGVPVTASHYYMTDVLRDSLGFKGYVYSDWGSVERLKDVHHAAATKEEAARMALTAGVDLDIDDAYSTLEKQVEDGIVKMADIDLAVSRMLRTKFALGLFDQPLSMQPKGKNKKKKNESTAMPERDLTMARRVAEESAVMLQNNGILPLDVNNYKRIAVIGPNANQTVYGDYSWTYGDTKEGTTLLQGLKDAVGDRAEVAYAEGCDWWSQDASHIADAVEVVKNSDVAIVAVGTRSTYLARSPQKQTSGEGFDLSDLNLPGCQQQLLEAVKETGKPVIVIFISGKPLAMPWVKENADALLVQWYAGEEQGRAAADILLGNVNPSGRLNVSFPRSTGTTPCFYNYNITERESIYDPAGTLDDPKNHYIFDKPEPLWWFGEGLSYTTYEYDNLRVSAIDNLTATDTVTVNLTVSNTGDRDGSEVVQLYFRDKVSSVNTPKQQLRAFTKVFIPAGETREVSLALPIDELALYNERMQRVVEPGDFELQIGHSANDIRLRQDITVK